MNYRNRMAAGAVALAAILIPAGALASILHPTAKLDSTSAPASAVARLSRHSAPIPQSGSRDVVPPVDATGAARRHGASATAAAAPAAGGPPPSQAVLKLGHDEALASATINQPSFHAHLLSWVKCMNERGLPTQATPAGATAGGWTYGDPTTAHARLLESLAGEGARQQIEDACVVQAFGL